MFYISLKSFVKVLSLLLHILSFLCLVGFVSSYKGYMEENPELENQEDPHFEVEERKEVKLTSQGRGYSSDPEMFQKHSQLVRRLNQEKKNKDFQRATPKRRKPNRVKLCKLSRGSSFSSSTEGSSSAYTSTYATSISELQQDLSKRRARSLKEKFQKPNIDYPDFKNVDYLCFSPFPETVEEELHEDFTAARCKSPPMRSGYVKPYEFEEDFLKVKRRKSAEYIQALLQNPLNLKIVKETEEEYSSETKQIFSLSDLSKYLKDQMKLTSDDFDKKVTQHQRIYKTISIASQDAGSIRESDSEYEYSSSSDEYEIKSKGSNTPKVMRRRKRKSKILFDKLEPIDNYLTNLNKLKKRNKGVPLQEVITEERDEAEFFDNKPELLSKLKKSHNETKYIKKIISRDKLFGSSRLVPRSLSMGHGQTESILEEKSESRYIYKKYKKHNEKKGILSSQFQEQEGISENPEYLQE